MSSLLALLYVLFSCVVFVTFLCGVLGHVWYLIVSIPDPCLLTYLKWVKVYCLLVSGKTIFLLGTVNIAMGVCVWGGGGQHINAIWF